MKFSNLKVSIFELVFFFMCDIIKIIEVGIVIRKLGFTLIELLAVIIILAIVALIATPIILEVIEESRLSTNRSQAEILLSAADTLYAKGLFDENLEKNLTVVMSYITC